MPYSNGQNRRRASARFEQRKLEITEREKSVAEREKRIAERERLGLSFFPQVPATMIAEGIKDLANRLFQPLRK